MVAWSAISWGLSEASSSGGRDTLAHRPAYRSKSTPIILVSEHFRSWHISDELLSVAMSGIGPKAEVDDHALLGFDPKYAVSATLAIIRTFSCQPKSSAKSDQLQQYAQINFQIDAYISGSRRPHPVLLPPNEASYSSTEASYRINSERFLARRMAHQWRGERASHLIPDCYSDGDIPRSRGS